MYFINAYHSIRAQRNAYIFNYSHCPFFLLWLSDKQNLYNWVFCGNEDPLMPNKVSFLQFYAYLANTIHQWQIKTVLEVKLKQWYKMSRVRYNTSWNLSTSWWWGQHENKVIPPMNNSILRREAMLKIWDLRTLLKNTANKADVETSQRDKSLWRN